MVPMWGSELVPPEGAVTVGTEAAPGAPMAAVDPGDAADVVATVVLADEELELLPHAARPKQPSAATATAERARHPSVRLPIVSPPCSPSKDAF